jgi:soluble lytic murein transglycosylase
MQLIPSTGRAVGRKEGIRVASAGMLFDPVLNIRLGTEYLRSQLTHWDGDWVKTLAAYNAGPTHVREWIDQFGYNDPAEFIENIPFSETRDYVQAVLRNGQVYRELYGREKAILASDVPDPDSSALPPAKLTNVALVSKAVAVRPLRGPAKASKPVPAKTAAAKAAAGKTSAAKTAAAKKTTAVAAARKPKPSPSKKATAPKHAAA